MLAKWKFSSERPPVVFRVECEESAKAFIRDLRSVVATKKGGGWIVIDAMYEHRIDWPAWYIYKQHLSDKIYSYLSKGGDESAFYEGMRVNQVDWYGSDWVNPVQMTSRTGKPLSELHIALHNIPAPILLSYIHNIREHTKVYPYRSAIPFNDYEIQQLINLKLASPPPIEDIIKKMTIEDIAHILRKHGVTLKKTNKANYVSALVAAAHSNADITSKIQNQPVTKLQINPPNGLTWENFHNLRDQIRDMGHILYDFLIGDTSVSPVADKLLSL